MGEFVTNIICAVICGIIVWVAKTTVPLIKARLESTRYSWAADIIEYTVRAYEQMTEGSGQGDEKFRLVMEAVQSDLAKYGIHLTNTQIATMIEAAVQAMNTEKDFNKYIADSIEENV